MTDLVEVGKAKAAGIVSILIGITAFGDLICGFIYAMKGGPDGSGIWTGLGVCYNLIYLTSFTFQASLYERQQQIARTK